ncbi:MAG: hypothetical protein ACPGVU_23885 [Limisphaerales bacterium]
MKRILLTILSAACIANVSAQETAPIAKAREFARILTQKVDQLENKPFTLELDLEQPQVLAKDNRGGMVIPAKGLNADTIAKAGGKLVPVGLLWFRNLLPGSGAIAAADDRDVRSVELQHDGKAVTMHPFFAGVQKGQRGLDLVLFGKSSKEPYLKTRLRALPSRQKLPIELAAYPGDDTGAVLMVSIGGKYQAELSIVPHDTDERPVANSSKSGKASSKAAEAAHRLKGHLNDFKAKHVKVAGDPNNADLFEKNGIAVLIIPDKNLSADSLAKVGKKEIPLGQMWMKDLVPDVNGQFPADSDLKQVTLNADGKKHELAQFLLTAQRSGKKLNLAVYSGAQEPLMAVPLADFETGNSLPIEVEGESRDDSTGLLNLYVLGKYHAKMVVRPD